MISKVSIHNFKCLRDVRIDLERFTVFVGPNASGKTSILQGLDLLSRAFRDTQAFNDGLVSQVMSRGATDAVELIVESGGQCFRYSSARLSPGNGVPGAGAAREIAADFDSPAWMLSDSIGGNTLHLPLSVLLRLEASKLIFSAPCFPDPTIMAPDGTGMHTSLASMALNDPDSWQALQADLRRIIPTIRRLRHTKTPIDPSKPPSLLFDVLGADSLPADQVSEGTLLVLGLLTALHGSDRPSLVLLDDMDRGLHPRAQKDLVTLLRGLLDTKPGLQIVATTHSPYLLNWVQANEVRMTCLQDGATLCAPLEDHPKFEKWKDEMSSGEMWSLFGEKWLVEKVGVIA